ncbi:MAG: TolC family protein [Vicinamibacterales bacterium]
MLALLHASAAAAQTPLRLTLDDAQIRAVEQSHRVGEARARQQGADAGVVVRSKADVPTLTALGGYTRTNHIDEFGVPQPNGQLRVIYPDIPDNFRTRLELQWPIYTSGRTDALERAARAEAAATGADLAAVRLDLRLEVARAYWALVTARDTVRVLEAAVATADRSLADVRTRVEAGLLPPNDVSRSEAQRARQELLLIEARGRVDAVTIDLDRLLGLPEGTPIEPADGLETPPPPSRDAQALAGEALQQRPELAALADRTVAAEERITAIGTARKPMVAVNSGVDWANPNPRIFPRADTWQESWDVSLNVSWQLFDWGRNAAERTEARFAVAALNERRAETEQQIRADVRRQVLDLGTTQAALVPARLAVSAAQETQRVVADRFEAGVATTLDVLDAQLAVLQAELDRTRVLADLRLAEARLARILGR